MSKSKSDWWNVNLNDATFDRFKGWIGDYGVASKAEPIKKCIEKSYKSFLDVGCGTCEMFLGFKAANYEIKYTGVDSCKYLIDRAKKLNIDIVESDVIKIPVDDNS